MQIQIQIQTQIQVGTYVVTILFWSATAIIQCGATADATKRMDTRSELLLTSRSKIFRI